MKVSIIVPFHNTSETLILRCISSVLRQTYQNYELLLVNDGSSIYEQAFYENVCSMDSRIKMHMKKSTGVSDCRNQGLTLAKGELICFIDSDDTVESFFLEEAIKYISLYDLDVVIGGARFVTKRGTTDYCIKLPFESSIKVYDKDAIVYLIMQMLSDCKVRERCELSTCLNGSPCWRLYKKKIFNNNFFDTKVIIHEDKLFNLEIFKNASAIGVCKSIWYNYYQYSNSSIHKYQADLKESLLEILKVLKPDLQISNKNLLKHYYKFVLDDIQNYLYNHLFHKSNKDLLNVKNKEFCSLIKEPIIAYYKKNFHLCGLKKRIVYPTLSCTKFVIGCHQLKLKASFRKPTLVLFIKVHSLDI